MAEKKAGGAGVFLTGLQARFELRVAGGSVAPLRDDVQKRRQVYIFGLDTTKLNKPDSFPREGGQLPSTGLHISNAPQLP